MAAVLVAGCAASHTTVVKPSGPPVQLQTATKQELIARYNEQADAVTSLNATVTMTLTAGSAYTGVIKQYHEIKAFILAQKPSSIRVIGQAPVVGTNIFDMESDGETFRIFIPSQNKFLTGPGESGTALSEADRKPAAATYDRRDFLGCDSGAIAGAAGGSERRRLAVLRADGRSTHRQIRRGRTGSRLGDRAEGLV